MNNEIKNLEILTPKAQKFILTHYHGGNSICFGVEQKESDAHSLINQNFKNTYGWNVGDIVDGREVYSVSRRVDHIDDHSDRGLDPQKEGETGIEHLRRISMYFYYTAAVTRIFKNPLNILVYDDELNGATPLE